jgi:hypothetical protein
MDNTKQERREWLANIQDNFIKMRFYKRLGVVLVTFGILAFVIINL